MEKHKHGIKSSYIYYDIKSNTTIHEIKCICGKIFKVKIPQGAKKEYKKHISNCNKPPTRICRYCRKPCYGFTCKKCRGRKKYGGLSRAKSVRRWKAKHKEDIK